jgi:hypothetical protein
MRPANRWTLTMMASRDDGALFLLRPVTGVHAHVRELLDSDLALLEFTVVLPRSRAEELQDALTLGDPPRHEGDHWQFVSGD